MDRKLLEPFLERQLLLHDSRWFYLRALKAQGWNVEQLLGAVTEYVRTPALNRAFDIDLLDRDGEPRLLVRRLPVLAA